MAYNASFLASGSSSHLITAFNSKSGLGAFSRLGFKYLFWRFIRPGGSHDLGQFFVMAETIDVTIPDAVPLHWHRVNSSGSCPIGQLKQ